MENTLKVIKPFFIMEEGDTFERTENDTYKSEYSSSDTVVDDEFDNLTSSYKSSYEISEQYAKLLVDDGYLEEVKNSKEFVNVFDEISKLTQKYEDEISKLNEEFKNLPACLKIEKETVLKNLIEILNHLNSLKK